MTVRFSNQLVADLIQPFWAAWQAGEFMTDASSDVGAVAATAPTGVPRWGGVLTHPSQTALTMGAGDLRRRRR